jgi:hypothetical protein
MRVALSGIGSRQSEGKICNGDIVISAHVESGDLRAGKAG